MLICFVALLVFYLDSGGEMRYEADRSQQSEFKIQGDSEPKLAARVDIPKTKNPGQQMLEV